MQEKPNSEVNTLWQVGNFCIELPIDFGIRKPLPLLVPTGLDVEFFEAMSLDFSKLAQSAYHAYGSSTNFQNFMGDPMPNWQALPDKIKHAWVAAAKQVVKDMKIEDED